MYFVPLYRLLDRNAAPPHAKVVMAKLLTCTGTRKMNLRAFLADREMQALVTLDLVAWKDRRLVVTEKARKLVEAD